MHIICELYIVENVNVMSSLLVLALRLRLQAETVGAGVVFSVGEARGPGGVEPNNEGLMEKEKDEV